MKMIVMVSMSAPMAAISAAACHDWSALGAV
jgi:hypothetical protein